MTTITPSKFRATETVIKFSKTPVTVLTTDPLDSLMTAQTQAESLFKNVTVTPPEGGVDKIDLLGVELDDTYEDTDPGKIGFQNALLDEKPYALATFTGTAVLNRAGFFEDFIDASSISLTSGTNTLDRFRFGVVSTSTLGRPSIAVLVQNLYPYIGTATAKWNALLNNAYITKLGDYRISGADGHWEVDVTGVCLPKDFYLERIRE